LYSKLHTGPVHVPGISAPQILASLREAIV
jgi:hypothetical protein